MAPTNLKLGQDAPDFQAQSNAGIIALAQFRGRWLVLFSYARDDTPVCTIQCLSFAAQQQAFTDLGARLVGLSVDSGESHRRWLAKLEKEKGVTLAFPLIADEDKKVARLYGLMDEERGLTIRGVFIIDPQGKVRFMAYYPLRVAPSADEVLRVLRELQG